MLQLFGHNIGVMKNRKEKKKNNSTMQTLLTRERFMKKKCTQVIDQNKHTNKIKKKKSDSM
jgi:hypothetical protein